MKKGLILLIFLTLCITVVGQNIPKNIFSIGSGIYNRGVVSLEHCYNWELHENKFISLESSVGLTPDVTVGNFTLAPTFNVGNRPNYFTVGLENKFFLNQSFAVVDKDWGFPFFESYNYTGYAIAPFIGYNVVGGNWFNLKIRATLTILTKNYAEYVGQGKQVKLRPGIGLSLGIFKAKNGT